MQSSLRKCVGPGGGLPTLRQPGGRYLVTGCLMTRSSLSGPLVARMLSFCSS
jgi:hypothetical protein